MIDSPRAPMRGAIIERLQPGWQRERFGAHYEIGREDLAAEVLELGSKEESPQSRLDRRLHGEIIQFPAI